MTQGKSGTLLDAVAQRQRIKKLDDAARIRKLVIAYQNCNDGTGPEIDAEEFSIEVEQVGLPYDQIEPRAEIYGRRKNLAKQVAEGDVAESELPKFRDQLSAKIEEKTKFLERIDREINAIQYQIDRRNEAISGRQTAKHELRHSVGDDIREKLADIQRATKDKRRELAELERDAETHHQSHLHNARLAEEGKLEQSGVDGLKGSYERLQRKQLAVSAAKAELQALDEQYRQIIETDALKPENF